MLGIPCSVVLVATLSRLAAAQFHSDTITLRGFIQQNVGGAHWALVTPLPVSALGVRTFVIELPEGDRWSRFTSHFVSASGKLVRSAAGQLGLVADSVAEVEPAGTTHRTYDRGLTQHSRLSLAVIPNRFSWSDSAGKPTGVNPVILYGIGNDRAAPIYFVLTTNELVCLNVKGNGSTWDTTTVELNPTYHRFVIQHGGEFHQGLQLPKEGAPHPGRYVATASICQVEGYEVTAEFEVY